LFKQGFLLVFHARGKREDRLRELTGLVSVLIQSVIPETYLMILMLSPGRTLMQNLLAFSKELWAMKVLPGFKRGSGSGPFVVVAVVVVIVVVDAVDGRATMVLETEIDLAVLEVALDAREMGHFSGETNLGFLGW
jgi:hypothetical protein